jgi:hypothetical protein
MAFDGGDLYFLELRQDATGYLWFRGYLFGITEWQLAETTLHLTLVGLNVAGRSVTLEISGYVAQQLPGILLRLWDKRVDARWERRLYREEGYERQRHSIRKEIERARTQ